MSDSKSGASAKDEFSRRSFLGAGSVALATAALADLPAKGQQQGKNDPASNPGQENNPLLLENPSSNTPPATDHGAVGPIWYSFDLAHKRMEKGGWTHE